MFHMLSGPMAQCLLIKPQQLSLEQLEKEVKTVISGIRSSQIYDANRLPSGQHCRRDI